MTFDNRFICECWQGNIDCVGGNMHTDGSSLWSYSLMIGETYDDRKILYDYTGTHKVTQTTSQHVNLAREYATMVLLPDDPMIHTKAWKEAAIKFCNGYSLDDLERLSSLSDMATKLNDEISYLKHQNFEMYANYKMTGDPYDDSWDRVEEE